MNNKGFAISTMLYGMLIIASLVIFTIVSLTTFGKKTQTDFVDEVETELLKIHSNTYCN